MTENRIVWYLWLAFQILVGYNLLLPLILFCVYQVKRRSESKNQTSLEIEPDYAVIVTAYEQTNLLRSVINSILSLRYTNYLVYVVADKCDISDLRFDDPRVILLKPEQTLASNIRSHFYAIEHFKRDHARLTIIDSDNIVHPEYLHELNKYFDQGFSAVQGVREAKNLNTTLACLDAARDIYYHFYDGKILFGMGSSATLAGSGMAFTTTLYVRCLTEIIVNGAGFDKVLQYQIVKRGYRIAFANQAIIFDEKTSKPNQLIKQRARWINTWFKYFSFGFKLVTQGLLKLNWNQFLFGIILLRPPLFMFLILSILFLSVNLITFLPLAIIWALGLLVFSAGFFIALVLSGADKKIFLSLNAIPKFVFLQILSLANVRSANKTSVATNHYVLDVDERKNELKT